MLTEPRRDGKNVKGCYVVDFLDGGSREEPQEQSPTLTFQGTDLLPSQAEKLFSGAESEESKSGRRSEGEPVCLLFYLRVHSIYDT